jgi:predicted transcriptional regulator
MKTARLNIRLDAPLLARLREMAKRNDRTLKAEVSRALTKHLDEGKRNPSP